jgi:hypothetical protein
MSGGALQAFRMRVGQSAAGSVITMLSLAGFADPESSPAGAIPETDAALTKLPQEGARAAVVYLHGVLELASLFIAIQDSCHLACLGDSARLRSPLTLRLSAEWHAERAERRGRFVIAPAVVTR